MRIQIRGDNGSGYRKRRRFVEDSANIRRTLRRLLDSVPTNLRHAERFPERGRVDWQIQRIGMYNHHCIRETMVEPR